MSATSSTNSSANSRDWITFSPYTEKRFVINLQKTPSGDEFEEIGYFQSKEDEQDSPIPFITYDPSSPSDATSRLSVFEKFCKFIMSFSATNRTKFTNYLNKHRFNSENPHNFKQIFLKTQRIYIKSREERLRKLIPSSLTSTEFRRIITSSELEILPPPEKPFELVSAILKSSGTFEKLITNTLLLLGKSESKQKIPNLFETQCTHSSLTLGNLFFGPNFTRLIKCISRIKIFISTKTTFYLNQNEFEYYCVFEKIFLGLIITEIRKDNHLLFNGEDDTALLNKIIELQNKFRDEIFNGFFHKRGAEKLNAKFYSKIKDFTVLSQNLILKDLYKKLILKCPFNIKNLENLHSEMKENIEFISAENTCFYFIEMKNVYETLDHSFTIEQFQRQSDQKVCYRLYQSWIGQSTLSEDMDKRGYDREGKNAMKWKEMERLLNTFKSYLMDPKDGEKDVLKDIFGCTFLYTQSPRTTFNEETKIVRSRDLVYWCEFKNPNDCQRHFMELATSFPPQTPETINPLA